MTHGPQRGQDVGVQEWSGATVPLTVAAAGAARRPCLACRLASSDVPTATTKKVDQADVCARQDLSTGGRGVPPFHRATPNEFPIECLRGGRLCGYVRLFATALGEACASHASPG